MRKVFSFLLFLLFYISSKSQGYTNGGVENVMQRIPSHLTHATSDIAEYVKQHFTTEKEKVFAIYKWITANIRYSTDSANNINLGPDPQAKITAALRRRKGVCENYAALFNDICRKAGLTCFVVDGYTKQNGSVDKTGHSWCAVFIEDNWVLCDPTWDDATAATKWFLVQPSAMIETHMPFDNMWQLLHYPVSHKQFYGGNTYEDKNKPYFNYNDTIAAYIKMDSLQRFTSAAYRIAQSGLYNTLVKDREAYTKMHIEIIRQDKDVELYNSSVADLNSAAITFNNFVQFRNKQFTPAITDNVLQSLLDGLDIKLLKARKNLDEIDKSEAAFKFSTEELKVRLNNLLAGIKEQQDFLKVYLNTASAVRPSLFYKQVSSSNK